MIWRWHLTQLFYNWHPNDVDDTIGNHILTQWVRPLIRDLKQIGIIQHATFNRFAQQGNHIQVMVQIQPEQHAHLEGIITEKTTAYLDEHHKWFAPDEMQIAPLGEFIQNDKPLHHPGQFVMQLFQQTQNDVVQALFENPTIQAHDDQWQHFVCQMWLTLLSQSLTPQTRMQVLRLWLVYTFQMLNITPQDQAIILSFLIHQWTHHFHIEAEFSRHIANYYHHIDTYTRYFTQFNQHQEDVSPMLPNGLRPFFRHIQQFSQTFIPNHPILVYESDGRLTDYSLLRCFGMFHINHNRLAIDIFKELFWAYVMLQHLLPKLSTTDLIEVKTAVTRLGQHFEHYQGR